MSGKDSYTNSAPPLGFDDAWINHQLKNGSGVDLLTAQILSQRTYDKWTGQGFGSVYENARTIANSLANAGISRLEDFGRRTVEKDELFFGDEGLEYRKAQLPEFYNKKTGQALSDQRAENETTFGRTYAGDGSTTFNVHFNEMGMPIFYSQYGGSSSDWGSIAPLLAVASFVPGIAPFAMAFSAVGNAYNGNYVGAVLSALGAANAFGAQYSAVNPTAANYVNGLDVASDIAAGVSSASVVTTAANWLAANAGNIRTAQQAVGLLNALDKRNVAGIVDALVNIAPQVGVTIPSDFVKPINIAAMASAASKGDWAGALNAAQLLTTNPALRQDIKLAEKATNFANAIKTGNPASMMTTFMDLAKHQNLGTGTVQLASKNLGMPMSTATANKMLESGDMDQQVKEYYLLVNKVSQSYEDNFNQPVTPEMLASFAENGGILEGYNAYVQDKRSTHPDELVDLLKKAGLKSSDLSDEQTANIYRMSEMAAESYLQNLSDIKEFTYDGSKAGSKEAAAAEAIKNGYNTFKAPDGQTYTTMPGSVASKLINDAATGKNVGINTNDLQTITGSKLRLGDGGRVYSDDGSYSFVDKEGTVVIVAQRLDKPLPTDVEAWKAYQDELKSLGGASFTKKFTDQLDILTAAFKDTKPDTMQDVLKNILAYGSRSFGGLASTLLTGAQALGLSKDSAALKVANAIERWGKTNQSSGIIDAEGAFSKAINGITKESIAAKLGTTPDKISDFQVAREQLKELGSQMVKNPKGTFSVGLVEGLQEIPFLAASAGIGSVAAKMMGKAAGFAVARGSDAALNGFESFSGNYAEVKEYLVKNGYSESKAEAKAIASGLESMGVTMLTSWVGDKAILKSFMGDITKDSVANIAGAGAKEYVMGYVEGGLQNASAQIAKYGEIRNMAEVTAAGTIEGFVQSGLTTGTLSADKLSRVVARDYDGKGVTLGSILDGNSTFDPGTLNSNFELTAGFNIGDAVKYQKVFDSDPNVTPTEYMKTAEFFRGEGFDPTIEDIAKIAGGEKDLTGDDLKNAATSYADERVVSEGEARKALVDLGYTDPTASEISAFVGQRNERDTVAEIIKQYNPLATTPQEVKDVMKSLGYAAPTDAEAAALAGKIKESDARKNIEAYVAPRNVTREEAEQFFRDINYTPTKEEIDQFVRQGADVNQDAVRAEAAAYADPKMVDEGEVRAAYEALGLKKPTQQDILKLVGQYGESDLAGKAQQNLDPARYNSIIEQLDNMSVGKSPEVVEAIEKVKSDLNNKITEMGGNVENLIAGVTTQVAGIQADMDAKYNALTDSQKALADSLQKQGLSLTSAIDQVQSQTQQQIEDTRIALESAISDAQKGDAKRFDDIDSAIQALKDAGLTAEQVEKIVSDASANLSQDFKDALNTAAKGNSDALDVLKTGLEGKISDARIAMEEAIADAKAVGLKGDAAIQSAIDKVAADLGTSKADLLAQMGTTEANLKSEFATQLGALESSVNEKYNALNDAQKALADQLASQGVDMAAAIEQAQKQTQGQISELSLDVQAKYDALTAEQKATADALTAQGKSLADAIEAAKTETAGKISDLEKTTREQYDALTAEQKATADALTAQGKTLADAIAAAKAETAGQIGNLAADVQAKYDSLTAEQKALADSLKQQGIDFAAAIEQAEKSTAGQIKGLSEDMQAKYDSLSAEQKALAESLSKQGVDLNTAIETAKSSIQADVQAKYDSLTESQKNLADQLTKQGVDLNAAIEQAKAQASEQVSNLSADMQAKYDALTAEQKTLADTLRQQGVDLNTAIETAASSIRADVQAKYDSLTEGQKNLADQLAQQGVDLSAAIDIASKQSQQQILDLGSSLNQRVDELVSQGKTQYEATQQAIAEVNQQNQQLQGLVGTQGRAANQSDIDALTQMIGGQRSVDLAYDVTGDKQINNDDLDFLRNLVNNNQTQWTAPAGSPWAPTGLYGELAAAEAKRQADLDAANRQREADIVAQQTAAREAERRSAIRSTAGMAGAQVQQIMQQLPQAVRGLQQTNTPIYAGGMQEFDLGSPLDVGFFDLRKEAQGGQKQQQTTKIATGGYLDDLLDLLR